jgi:hypothetical protein
MPRRQPPPEKQLDPDKKESSPLDSRMVDHYNPAALGLVVSDLSFLKKV